MASTIKGRISARTVEALTCPEKGEVRLWDDKLAGFFVRAYSTGRKIYALRYRAGRIQRILTIGLHGTPWTAETAREAALDAMETIRAGGDPSAEKRASRNALTVNELIEQYLCDGPATKPSKRQSTWEIDASNLRRHMCPLIGKLTANDVTKAQATKAYADICNGKTAKLMKSVKSRGVIRVAGGEGTAKRTMTTTSAMYNWGIEYGYVNTNPFKGLKLPVSHAKERFLSQDEAASFLDALTRLEMQKRLSSAHADAIRLLLLTGARKTEITALKWNEVNFTSRKLVLPPDRTKSGGKAGERQIVLMPAALQILSARHANRGKERYVFPGRGDDVPVVGLRRSFLKVCEEASISDLRLHDLRHSFASFAIADGASLFLVSKLLGHASTRVTERYAHLNADPLEQAVKKIGQRFKLPNPENPESHQLDEVAAIHGKQVSGHIA